MATIRFHVTGTKRESVPIYVRFSGGRNNSFMVRSGFQVKPTQWSNKTQTIKQRIRSDADEQFIKDLSSLKEYLNTEIRNHHTDFTKEWLERIIDKYYNKNSGNVRT